MAQRKTYKGYHLNPESGEDMSTGRWKTFWEVYDVERERTVAIAENLSEARQLVNEDIEEQKALDRAEEGNPMSQPRRFATEAEANDKATNLANNEPGQSFYIGRYGRLPGYEGQDGYYITKGNMVSGLYMDDGSFGSVMGNPGNVPLMETLSDVAQFVDYEAEVVATAAEQIDDPAIAREAEQQAEAMEDAAEALQEASEAAAETAAEVFNETGVPSDEQGAEVVAGNPVTIDNALVDRLAEVHYREELESMAAQAEAGTLYPGAGKDFQEAWAETYRQAAAKAASIEGNPVTQSNAPASRQTAGQSNLQGVGAPGQHASQPQTIVAGNPIVNNAASMGASTGVSNRAAGGASNVIIGNPGDPGEAAHQLRAERNRIAKLNWREDALGRTERDGILEALDKVISDLEASQQFGYVTEGNPIDAEDVVEEIAEKETITEDEAPTIDHWFFRPLHLSKPKILTGRK